MSNMLYSERPSDPIEKKTRTPQFCCHPYTLSLAIGLTRKTCCIGQVEFYLPLREMQCHPCFLRKLFSQSILMPFKESRRQLHKMCSRVWSGIINFGAHCTTRRIPAATVFCFPFFPLSLSLFLSLSLPLSLSSSSPRSKSCSLLIQTFVGEFHSSRLS